MLNFKKIFVRKLTKIGVKKNQTIILTFDLLKLILFLRKKKIQLNLDDIIESIKQIIGENGNIIVYSFLGVLKLVYLIITRLSLHLDL